MYKVIWANTFKNSPNVSRIFRLSRCGLWSAAHTFFVIYKCLIKILLTFQPKVYANHVTSFNINNEHAQSAPDTTIRICTYEFQTIFFHSRWPHFPFRVGFLFLCKNSAFMGRSRRAQIIKWFERFSRDPYNKLLLSLIMFFDA